MSKNKTVMSHDPLADLDAEVSGEVVQVPEEALEQIADKTDVEESESNGTLVLEASLTISDVGEYHPVLLKHLVTDSALVIDGSQVEIIDGAGLQLLAAFVKDLIGKSSAVSWSGASDKLLKSAHDMGISTALQLEDFDQAA